MRTKLMTRDRIILYILAGLGVAKALDIAFLAGFNNLKYCRKRLYYLKDLGYIADDAIDREKVYFLTKDGYRETERFDKTYEFSNHTIHDVAVARIATYLYIAEGISYWDMITDRQMKYILKGKNIHRVDLVIGSTAYEFERSLKMQDQIEHNVESNQRFDKQIWIVPEHKHTIKQKLRTAAKKVHAHNFEIVNFEDILYMVSEEKLKDNTLRKDAVLGERDFEQLTRPNLVGEWSKYL